MLVIIMGILTTVVTSSSQVHDILVCKYDSLGRSSQAKSLWWVCIGRYLYVAIGRMYTTSIVVYYIIHCAASLICGISGSLL